MMVVITMSNCPPKLRGDLTKWFIEIDTGVFVGNLSARVRDAVWKRVCENIKNGRASMAFGTNGEQKLDFRIHNTQWEPVDYDGIKLVRRNTVFDEDADYKKHSKAMTNHIANLSQAKKKSTECEEKYVVIDIETTGLNDDDEITEIGALLIEDGKIKERFSILVNCNKKIPEQVTKLTGITKDMIEKGGVPLKDGIKYFSEFCGNCLLVGHNINFDMQFLQKACKTNGLPPIKNRLKDTMKLSRKKLDNAKGYSLCAVADTLGLEYQNLHRAQDDCELTYRIYEKLNEL
jgi:CRISPR-associated protein Cas2